MQAIADKAILAGIAAAAGTITAESGIGAVVGYGAAALIVVDIYADQFSRAIGLYQRWYEQLTPEEREQLLTDTRRHIHDRWTQEPPHP